ncbi:hypothetical protein BB389_01135 [Helicobacter pylori]|nr:hypothetical protein BB389_01135 [Helicobacter pylori]
MLSLVRFSFSAVRFLFSLSSLSLSLVRSVLSLFSLAFSSWTSWTFLSVSSFFKASFGFSWVSLEDFLKKRPMQREIFIRGSKSSNLPSNFLRRSVRSLTDFKSSLLFKSSSLLLGGWKQWDLKYLVFLFSHYSYFLQYERHS